jgi:hypothetical protein
MHALVLALTVLGQYPSGQSLYSAPPPQYAAPPPPVAYSAPVTYAAPQVVTLGAGQVIPPGPIGLFLGHVGRRLERHSWPRMQPMQAAPMATAAPVVYLAVAPPQYQVIQASYAAPQQTYAAPPPQTPAKSPATPYSSPQTPTGGLYGAPKPNEAAPTPPGR